MTRDSSILVTARSPVVCTDEELFAFKQLVLEGGEVNPGTLPTLVSRALSIAFVYVGEELVAVGAIKRPNPGYRADVFANAGLKRDPAEFEFELGWVYVHPSARGKGLASALVAALVHELHGARVYATSRVNNARMHASLNRHGFKQVGAQYESKINEQKVQMFLRE